MNNMAYIRVKLNKECSQIDEETLESTLSKIDEFNIANWYGGDGETIFFSSELTAANAKEQLEKALIRLKAWHPETHIVLNLSCSSVSEGVSIKSHTIDFDSQADILINEEVLDYTALNLIAINQEVSCFDDSKAENCGLKDFCKVLIEMDSRLLDTQQLKDNLEDTLQAYHQKYADKPITVEHLDTDEDVASSLIVSRLAEILR